MSSSASARVSDRADELGVVDRLPTGRVVRAKHTLIDGFARGGFFYTRSAAERACKEWGSPPR